MHLGEECRKEAKAKAKWCVCVCEAEGMSMSESRRGGVARAQHTVSDVQSMMSPVRGGALRRRGTGPPPPPPRRPRPRHLPRVPCDTKGGKGRGRTGEIGGRGGERWLDWGGYGEKGVCGDAGGRFYLAVDEAGSVSAVFFGEVLSLVNFTCRTPKQ